MNSINEVLVACKNGGIKYKILNSRTLVIKNCKKSKFVLDLPSMFSVDYNSNYNYIVEQL